MFDVRGDTVIFKGEPIATLHNPRVIGRRIDAERALIEWQDPSYLVTEEDHAEEVEEAEARGEKAGYASGFEDGKSEAKVEADEQAEAREKEAYADGRADALADVERAQDAKRVGDLLAALKKAEALLFLGKSGVRQPGEYRNRPAKISELKKAMAEAQWTLRRAFIDYESPNT